MASIALMIGGAILNATSFVGGSYLAKYLSGNDSDAETERHDREQEKFQRDSEAYQENREKLADWVSEQEKAENQAWKNMDDTDKALVLYNKVHDQAQIPDLEEPQWRNYYKPSEDQKTGEMIYVGGGMLALGYLASRFL